MCLGNTCPEHFSPQQLKDIVDGKLIENKKYTLECENKEKKITGTTWYGEEISKFITHYFIKLNPYITIYPVQEERMIPLSLLKKAFDYGYWMSASNEYNDSISKNTAYNEWENKQLDKLK
jgi:hypothetical protein